MQSSACRRSASAAALLAIIGVSEAFVGPAIQSSSAFNPQSTFAIKSRRLPSLPFSPALRSSQAARQSLALQMVAVHPQQKHEVRKGTDPEKLKLGRYQLFPQSKMNMELDLDGFKFKGGHDLRRLYHDSDQIIIAEYYLEKCPTCRMSRQIMHSIINKLDGRVQFVEVNLRQNQDVIKHAGLLTVPAVQIFKAGKIIDHFSGLHPKSKLKNRMLKLLEDHQDIY
eukprot:CAMPEP_0181338066 /NCGR_PEP_ID=MMETSP1101-20121128/28424_1 /TAXON_ID=46948 /ORGANISM="Rhodomonas abbreviata, Strain Caron Lab Isolate" /LENGTH=224 /DNA_ID=CAMNT_0023448743 /DNA_START=26 /DNA_END=700 /DNA_ORIENTATION=+